MSPVFGPQERILEFVNSGPKTYTGQIQLPPRAIITDILVLNQTEWNSATSASLEVGDDTDADGFFTAVNLKASGDIPAGEAVSLGTPGASGVAGAYYDGTAVTWSGLYSASKRTLTATIVASGAGTTGLTFVVVKYNVPDRTYAARKIT